MVYQLRLGTNTLTASNTVGTISVGSAVPVGQTVGVSLAWDNGSATIPVISSVTDGRSNTYTTRAQAGTGSPTASCMLLQAPVTTALQAGDTITVTITGARVRWCLEANAFGSVGAFDQTQQTDAGASSTSLTTGATPATTYPSELDIAVFAFGAGRTITVPAGWTATGASVETAAGSTDRALQTIYQPVSATGAQTGTLTLNTASTYSAAIATFQLLMAPPPPNPVARLRPLLVR